MSSFKLSDILRTKLDPTASLETNQLVINSCKSGERIQT